MINLFPDRVRIQMLEDEVSDLRLQNASYHDRLNRLEHFLSIRIAGTDPEGQNRILAAFRASTETSR